MPASIDSFLWKGYGGWGTTSWTHNPAGNATSLLVIGDRRQGYHDLTSVTYGNKPLTLARHVSTNTSFGIHLCLWKLDDISGRDDNIIRVVSANDNYALTSVLIADSVGVVAGAQYGYGAGPASFAFEQSGLCLMAGSADDAAITSSAGQTTHNSGEYYSSKWLRHDSKRIELSGSVGMGGGGGVLGAAALLFGDIAGNAKRLRQALMVGV